MKRNKQSVDFAALVQEASREGVSRFVVGALVVRDGRLLLVRRVPEDFLGGLFELPGGGVEQGEGLLEAVEREVREETGLEVVHIRSYVGAFDYRSKSGRRTRQFNLVVDVSTGQPRLNPLEHDRFVWLERTEVGDINVSDSVRAVLTAFWGS